MARIFFVDDRPTEIIHLWEQSGCANNHVLLPLEVFNSVEHTCQMVDEFKPDIIFIGFGLGKPDVNGADVVRALRKKKYTGRIIANSGSGISQFENANVQVDRSVNRNPHDLRRIVQEGERNE